MLFLGVSGFMMLRSCGKRSAWSRGQTGPGCGVMGKDGAVGLPGSVWTPEGGCTRRRGAAGGLDGLGAWRWGAGQGRGRKAEGASARALWVEAGWCRQSPGPGASVRWGAVLGWGQAAECVQRLGSAQDSATLGAPRGPQPLLALKKARGHGVGASGARQLSHRSLRNPAHPPRLPRLPDCPLRGWTSRRQVSEAQGWPPAPAEPAPLGRPVCGPDLGVHRPLLQSGPPRV